METNSLLNTRELQRAAAEILGVAPERVRMKLKQIVVPLSGPLVNVYYPLLFVLNVSFTYGATTTNVFLFHQLYRVFEGIISGVNVTSPHSSYSVSRFVDRFSAVGSPSATGSVSLLCYEFNIV